ncbi:MAG: hypothetical protein GAK40_01497 [Burkholderia plantarii]|nr:MAG: hypothetical protein GAK40_01497 [Burkholderia plantarii]
MTWLSWLGWPVGIAVLLALVLHDGVGEVPRLLGRGGFALLWLVPFHALPLLLERRVSLGFLWWIATVREAVSRLLPAASVGGEIVGIRLARWRVADCGFVSATVVVEVLMTIAVQYVFSALGLVLLLAASGGAGLGAASGVSTIATALVLSAPLPVLIYVLLKRGGLFHAIERLANRMLGEARMRLPAVDGRQLDACITALLSRPALLGGAFAWQLAGYVVGALENDWALRLLGHPVTPGAAVAIEAMTQAVRHAAFMVPGGIGVQEGVIVLLAQQFGVDRETALSLALVKRGRELVFGALALASWQAAEIVRARRHLRVEAGPAGRDGAGASRPGRKRARAGDGAA